MSLAEYPKTWETVSTESDLTTLRMKVPGGWIMIVRDATNNTTQILFLSNPDHVWPLV